MTEQKQALLDEILLQIEKPARYIGNEVNMVLKTAPEIRFAFCFPDVYEVGMSHLGLQILYFFMNRREDTFCERAFTPWPDMEKQLVANELPLFALETGTPLKEFDFVGFTLQYEMSYTNLLTMLSLSGIPFLAEERREDDPIVCAGGPCAYNPEVLADVVDFFYLGEGEVVLDAILDLYKANQKNGGSKLDFLTALLPMKGVYVPRFYDVTYHEDGRIASFQPNHPDAPAVVEKVFVADLDSCFCPDTQLVPLIETIHDRVALEVFRGCFRGCRFCQAGYIYRPMREKKSETLLQQARTLVGCSGYDEISLVSLSTGDYSEFQELADGLMESFQNEKINLSLPSLRIDAFSLDLMKKVQGVRRSSLTFAPEAGTARMRDVINKGITEDEILDGCKLAFSGGWDRVKLYFMVGLPTETEEDLLGIVRLSEKIVGKYYETGKKSRPVSIVVSTSCFVPKPFTPFQWEAQDDYEVFMEKQKIIKRNIVKKQIQYNYHDAKLSVLEGAIARGDRRVAKAIIRAWELGARFDSWSEHFNMEFWEQAFLDVGLDYRFYSARKREQDEILPWDFISVGVTKEFLWQEYEQSLKEEITENCRAQCSNCGLLEFGGDQSARGVCHERGN